MNVLISPGNLGGILRAPASKSSMQRACAAALLSKGTWHIGNPGNSNDDLAALDIITKLGANVSFEKGSCIITSNGIKPLYDTIDCGESGLSIRMFTPIVALSENQITVKGSGSLLNRPMDFFDKILPTLGVEIKSNEGKLPLILKGPIKPASITVDGSLSSQFLTGLLMAYSASPMNEEVTIRVENLTSRPYIDLTLDVIRHFNLNVPENRNYEEFIFHKINVVGEKKQVGQYTVESDWSGGAFLLVAGAIAGPVTITGLDPASRQADKAVIDALMSAGAGIAFEAKGIRLHPSAMYAFNFDATNSPDLFPPLVALAAYCGGESRIQGLHRLTHKESNRAITLKEEFARLGVRIEFEDDTMVIHGGEGVKGARVHSRHDHRIAMACAVAALGASGDTIIEEAEAVKKSYPGFFDDLKSLGAIISLNHKFKLHE